MAINRSQDTLTSCNPELYDNIYQIRSADLKVPNSHAAIPKDTIERSASTEAMNRLQRPSENMVFEPNLLFRRIGKYVFLTVAMPPYFLLYGLPKWLLVEGFQLLAIGMTWLTKEVKQKIQKPLNLITQKINTLLFFIQMLAKRTIKPVVELGIQLRQFFQNMAQQFGKMNVAVFSTFKKLLKTPLKGLKKSQELINDLAENIKKQWVNSKNWLKGRALFFNEKIEGSLTWIKQTPQLVLGWGSARIQYLNNIQVAWTKKFVSKFEASSKAAQSCSDWAGKQMGFLKELVKKGLSAFGFVNQRTFMPFVRLMTNFFQSAWNKFSGFLQDRKKRSLVFLEKIQSKMKALTPQQTLEKLLPTSFLAKFPLFIRKLLAKIKKNPLTHALFRLSLSALTFVVVNVTKILQKSIKGVSNFYLKLAYGIHLFKARLIQLSKETLNTIQNSMTIAQNGFKNCLHGSLVVVFMTGILLSWGFESLGEITGRWISKVSFFNQRIAGKK